MEKNRILINDYTSPSADVIEFGLGSLVCASGDLDFTDGGSFEFNEFIG